MAGITDLRELAIGDEITYLDSFGEEMFGTVETVGDEGEMIVVQPHGMPEGETDLIGFADVIDVER
jgi:hypothetical protein